MAFEHRAASLGGLETRIVRSPGNVKPTGVIVLCHGYGAPGTDLVPLADELVSLAPALASCWFVFPTAPLALADINPLFGDARAWWPIEVGRFERALSSGRQEDLDALLDETPVGLASARHSMQRLLNELLAATGLAMSAVVLGGFSQGAMLTTDVCLHLEEAPAALVIMSGAFTSRSQWLARAGQRTGLRVLQSHGRQDPLLPYPIAESLGRALDAAGLKVDFVPFPGGHTIPAVVLSKLARLASDALF